MKRFFITVKKSVSHRAKHLGKSLAISLIAISLLPACESNSSSTDETQTIVSSGNTKLERMEQIDTQLRAAGVSIKHPGLSLYTVSGKSEAQLTEWRTIVHEYIGHAEAVLKIADRPDVAFGDKQKILAGLTGANRLLEMIETEIGNSRTPRSELNAEFWSELNECRKWSERPRSRQLYGIEFVIIENQASVRPEDSPGFHARLGREKRRIVEAIALRHRHCLEIEERYVLQFERQQNSNEDHGRIAKLKRQKEHINALLEALTASPRL